MKKFLKIAVCALAACLIAVSLFGCGQPKTDGKYVLANSAAQNGGPTCWLIEQNEDDPYQNVVGGVLNPEDFWIELKDGTMTVHGTITPVTVGSEIVFLAQSDYERVYKYTLETYSGNPVWYEIYEYGEDTLYHVLNDGTSLVFEYGEMGKGYWYNISYNRA